jgi:hypothetical protein
VRNIGKPFIDRLRCGSETASINDLTVFVEGAVMVPDIPKINAVRQLNPGLPAWNFRDEVMRRLLHGKQSLPSGRPAHPIYWDQSCVTINERQR